MNKIILRKDTVINIDKTNDYYLYYEEDSNRELIINIKDNIKVNIYIINQGYKIKNNITYNVGENSILIINKYYQGQEIKEDIKVNLNKESKIEYYFSSYTCQENIYNFLINHQERSESNLVNHFVCDKDGKVLVNIDTYAGKEAIKSILNQETRIVNLISNSSLIKPNMYIDIDDIKAKHSSVIGSFSQDSLFYLMSRGIIKKDAIKLLCDGFLFGNLKKEIKDIINKK